jgi:oligopeptide transport system permease protein
MLGFVLRRVLIAIPTILVIITVAFFMMRLAPGGPFDSERPLPPDVQERMLASFGLNKPISEQYIDYLGGLARGDLGPSMTYRDKTVADLISEGFPVSATIGLASVVLAIFVGTLLGGLAALRQNRASDFGVMTIAMVGISIPPFVTGPILALIFGLYLGWLPMGGLALGGDMTVRHLTLPVITLALPQIAVIARLMRASMIEVLRSNYVRTARAKGLSEMAVLSRHVLRAAILPLVSYLGPASAALITGSLVIERVFALPGIGGYFVTAAQLRDYPVVMGVVIIYATLIFVLNMLADLLYAVLNPKVSYD